MKPSKTKKIIGTLILVLVSLFLLFSAFGKLTAHPTALEMFAALHIPYLRIPLGIIEALVAVLLVIPRTNRIAVLITSGFLGGAILAELFFGMTGAFAGTILLLVWIGSALRHHTCYCGCANCQQCHEHCSDCKTGTCSLHPQGEACNCKPGCVCVKGKCTC
ncbi:MAG TPA: DoxX family protein [Candidatus Paceibacterota bacterium]|nr:DoxX family protein [Candidatus Paceibacterota bacterium]